MNILQNSICKIMLGYYRRFKCLSAGGSAQPVKQTLTDILSVLRRQELIRGEERESVLKSCTFWRVSVEHQTLSVSCKWVPFLSQHGPCVPARPVHGSSGSKA